MRLIRGDIGSRVDDEALKAFGLDLAQHQADDLELWPENETAVRVFIAMGTQWNVGMSGAIGLRYEALPAVFALEGIAPADQPGAFAGLRTLERAALEEMHRGG